MDAVTADPHSENASKQPRRDSRLAARAYARLEELIVSLELLPGSILSEGDIIQRTGIGRTPLREAMQRLIGCGLLVTLPRRGVMVSDINLQEHLALLETRRTLDGLIASRAARRATPQQREVLRSCARAMEAAVPREDLSEFMRLDRACDDILEAAARNSSAVRAVRPLHSQCRRFWHLYRHNGDLRRAAALHATLMFAVAEGSEREAVTASDALMDYLEQFTHTAFEIL